MRLSELCFFYNKMNVRQNFYTLCFSFIICTIFIVNYNFSGSTVKLDLNISRNLKDYISDTLLPHILPASICSDKKLLLVIITTRPNSFQTRQTIRETWGQKNDNVSFYFLFGEVKKDAALQRKIQNESVFFNDIIQERFVDSYNNLTLKSVYMLKIFNRYCSSHKYLMKVDDDLFLNVQKIVLILSKRTRNTGVILGRVRSILTPIRDKYSKWYMPYEWYPHDKFPKYVCGPGYVMSADVVKKLYECAKNTPFIHLEDVFLTGICAEKINIKPEQNELFVCNNFGFNFCYDKELVIFHYYTPDMIKYAYYLLNGDLCEVYKKLDVLNVSYFNEVPSFTSTPFCAFLSQKQL